MAGGHRGLNKSCTVLIVIAGMERFAFKGVASNLVTYLTDVVKMSNSAAAKTVNSWVGLTSIMPLLVVPLADSYCDRYSTILASSSLYVLGLVALTSTAFASASSPASKISTSSFRFWSLCLISLGQGGYNPSLQAFGAEQLETEDELPCTKDDQKPNKKSVFFQWWYFGVCTGSLLGVTVMSYIQDTFGWVLGFAMPTLAMVLSIVFFSYGTRIYRYISKDESMHNRSFSGMVRSIKEIVSKLKPTKISLSNEKSATVELELQEKPLCNQNSGSMNALEQNPQKCNNLLMNARVVLRLLPIWTMLLVFAIIFQQPVTFFTKQGMTMKRNIGSFKIPPATLQSAITVSIILLMPLYDKVLIPTTRLITRKEKGISVMQRMGIGMFLSIIAMVIAAVVEMRRVEISRIESKSETVPLSIFLLLPQSILLGVSDIFTVVGMQEFFYGEVPVRMRTMGLALYTSVFGVGSFLSALLISLVEFFTSSRGKEGSWFSDDLCEARLDKYYWLLALLSALSLFFYVILCRFFKSRSELEN
ncbi:putative amino acid permease [Tripterygium wilfordii]|uniref:Putative amino acid permease n=1 Tax=Tripterygium wilfordii TaxID=458696 RepID=A0A7J7D0Q3_TRIWF|nr:protein NRT1/ PTR FAMILY 5.8-like isoform X2 [Tripterygium wilfordii]KAF5739646.1 putative amino acid permease [Tripterygium wilfordii]